MTNEAASRAVFLSYASQDAEAARRLCEALRAAGIEVWFDQSELRGGDAWDAKIRKQIKDCALFVPIISANTQARLEGYFRREWRMAVERMHDMDDDMPFLVPVVIDDTPDAAARVPERFRERQWMRPPGGEAGNAFVERVAALLATGKVTQGSRLPPTVGAGGRPVPSRRRPARTWLFAGAVAIVTLAAGVFWWAAHSERQPAEAPGAGAPTGTGPVSAVANVVTAPSSPGPANPTRSDARSIAVLPFANLSPDADNAFFCDGMHEDVITALAKIRDLRVISRTSVMHYRDSAARNLRDIAAELGVHSVLEGSVRRAGNRVRITAQLINAQTDEHLWAETYDGDLTDVFALQSELAQKIAGSLHATLSTQERAALQRKPTHDVAAYDLYLRARTRFSNNANTPELVHEVTALLEDAIRRDPEFVLAYADLAKFNAVFYGDPRADPTPERLEQAKRALAEATRRAPNWGEVLVARGAVAMFCYNDLPSALANFRAAIDQLPNDADAWTWLAICELQAGQPAEALRTGEFALQLQPSSMEAGLVVIQANSVMRRYARAWQVYQQIKRGSPQIAAIVPEQFLQLAADGDFDHFLATFAARRPDPDNPERVLAWEVESAYWRQDFARVVELAGQHPDADIGEPPVRAPARMYQAHALFLSGQLGPARERATQALPSMNAEFRARVGATRALSIEAQCRAILGEGDAARRLMREAIESVSSRGGAGSAPDLQLDHLHVIATLGSKDETLTLLRELLRGPFAYGAPNVLRHDPVLVHLFGDDLRFEEVLRSASEL